MLRLVTGKPGSGKTYYAVSYLTKTYCDFDHISNEWVLRPDYLVISNIDNLRVDHWNLQKLIDDKGLENVFSVDFVEPIAKKYKRIIFIVDECQRYFPAKSEAKIPNSVWFFFEYHRHYGIDLILCSQHASSVSRRIVNIAETYIEAAPQTLRLGPQFRYSLVDVTTGEKISQSLVKPDPSVYLAYRSATVNSGLEKSKSYASRILLIGALAVIAGFAATVYVVLHFIGGSSSNPPVTAPASAPASAPAPAPASASAPALAPAPAPAPASPSPAAPAALAYSPPPPLTVSELLVYSAAGVSVSDIPRFPSVCRVTGEYLKCPHVFPVQFYYGASNVICRTAPTLDCVSLFRIRDAAPPPAPDSPVSSSSSSSVSPGSSSSSSPSSPVASSSSSSAFMFQSW